MRRKVAPVEILVVWRVRTDKIDPHGLVSRFGLGRKSRAWRRGDLLVGARLCQSSGVSIDLGASRSKSGACSKAMRFLVRRREFLGHIRALGLESELDFGLLVGADHSFAPSLSFPVALLQAAAGAGVSILVSTYPVSEGPMHPVRNGRLPLAADPARSRGRARRTARASRAQDPPAGASRQRGSARRRRPRARRPGRR